MSENKKPPIQWVEPPEGVTEYYANMVNLLWSLDDVRFKIGQLVDPSEKAAPGANFRPVALASAAVTLSWRNAKLLRDDLIALVNSYEKVNGEIVTSIVLAPSNEEAKNESS
jgi:hypothetical protein